MTQAILILVFFILIAVLMCTRKLQTILALPVLAVGIALIAGVPLFPVAGQADNSVITVVVEQGIMGQASAMASLILAAWLGQMMIHFGVTNKMVKTAAELGGDKAFLVTVLLCVATALLSIVLSGLGSTIMVGSIVLPIMLSVGVPPVVAGCAFLASRGIGLLLNVANWQVYINATGVNIEDVQGFIFILCFLTALAVLAFLIVSFKKNGIKFSCADKVEIIENTTSLKVNIFALLTPLIPIILVLFLKFPGEEGKVVGIKINTALIIAIIYLLVVTIVFNYKRFGKIIGDMSKSGVEGVSNSASAIILLMGIGMVLKSIGHPLVKEAIQPFLINIIPVSVIGYIIFFIIVAPLSLYRGPMNFWGLGSGMAALIVGLGVLPVNAIFGAFLASERIQAIADPTNSHSVWVGNYVGCDVNQIMFKLLPYLLALSSIAVIVSSIMFM